MTSRSLVSLAMVVLCLLVMHTDSVSAATVVANTGGGLMRWSLASSWDGGVPGVGDEVVIPDGASVLFDESTPKLRSIYIEEGASLIFDNGEGEDDDLLELYVESVIVAGYLELGREEMPLTRRVNVQLTNFETPIGRAADAQRSLWSKPYGQKMLAVIGKGHWEAHGRHHDTMWTRLRAHASVGDEKIKVDPPVDWKKNDKIILCSTDYQPAQTEEHIVVKVSKDGRTVTLQSPVAYNHYGKMETYHGFRADMRAEVGVLTSNVRIFGDMTAPTLEEEAYSAEVREDLPLYTIFGGHTLGVQQSIMKIEGVEFYDMGQGGRMARYPVHWHFRGDAPGQYLKRSSIRDTFNRAVTVHVTNDVVVEDNVVYNTLGHSIYLEDGPEIRNQFIRNLVVSSRSVGTGSADEVSGQFVYDGCSINPPGVRLQTHDATSSGFWIKNAQNTFIGNSAVGHSYGFWIHTDPVFDEPDFPGGCTICSETCKLEGIHASLPEVDTTGLVFVDNYAHSNGKSGWWVKENWTPAETNTVSGFTLYKNDIGLENYGVEYNDFEFVVALDNRQGIVTEWVRGRGVVNYKNCLVMGETDNHGTPEAAENGRDDFMRVMDGCSLIYPGVQRTTASYIDYRAAVVSGDGYQNFEDCVFANIPEGTCGWQTDDYWLAPPLNYNAGVFGVMQHGFKKHGSLWYPPDRSWKGIYFDNIFWAKAQGTPGDAELRNVAGTDAPYRFGGYKDIDGSFPCSEAGAYFFYNTERDQVPDACELRTNWNMYYCPYDGGDFRHIQISSYAHIWSQQTMPQGDYYLDWECGKSLPLEIASNSLDGVVHTGLGKQYTLRGLDTPFSNLLVNFTKSTFAPEDANDNYHLVIPQEGRFRVKHSTMDCSPWSGGGNDCRLEDPSYIEQECRCGVTYVRLNHWKSWGQWLEWEEDTSIPCPNSNCGSPYATPEGECSSLQTSDDKDFSTCALPAPPTEDRGWPKWPKIEYTYMDAPAPYDDACREESDGRCACDCTGNTKDPDCHKDATPKPKLKSVHHDDKKLYLRLKPKFFARDICYDVQAKEETIGSKWKYLKKCTKKEELEIKQSDVEKKFSSESNLPAWAEASYKLRVRVKHKKHATAHMCGALKSNWSNKVTSVYTP